MSVKPTDISHIEDVLRSYQYHRRADSETTKWAAVALILRVRSSTESDVLLIKRSEHPNDPWSGDMAMPGGRKEDTDETLQRAAERETYEEVGLDLKTFGTLLGRLDDVSAVARGRRLGLTIAPFVYALYSDPQLALNYEVQESHWVPLSDLASPAYRSTKIYEFAGSAIHLPCWNWHGRVVWGLTYNMIEMLLRITRP